MSLKRLPPGTVKLLSSSQVITGVSAAVKELIENSIDARAESIDVKLENYGLDKIEVRDDGCGISKVDTEFMCQKSFTSKIADFADLDSLHSYGFRGEALNSLCAVGQVTVTTITESEQIATSYKVDSNGLITDSKPSHINKGTIILVEGLFKNLPVRRQFLSSGRRKSDEIKKVEAVVKSLAVIHPSLRITLTHNKFIIWQKNKVRDLVQSLIQAVPPTVVRQLVTVAFHSPDNKMHIEILLPKKDCNIPVACFSSAQEAIMLYVNLRPVRHKQIEKVIQEEIFIYFGHYIPNGRYPFCLVSIEIPPNTLDVNLEPNKTKVLIKDLESLMDKMKQLFLCYYTGIKPRDEEDDKVLDVSLLKRKSDDLLLEGRSKVPRNDSEISNIVPSIFDENEVHLAGPCVEAAEEENDMPAKESSVSDSLFLGNKDDFSNVPFSSTQKSEENSPQSLEEFGTDLECVSEIAQVKCPEERTVDFQEPNPNTYFQKPEECKVPEDGTVVSEYGFVNSSLCMNESEIDENFLNCIDRIEAQGSIIEPEKTSPLKSTDIIPTEENKVILSKTEVGREVKADRDEVITSFLDGLTTPYKSCPESETDEKISPVLESSNENAFKDSFDIESITLSQWSKGQVKDQSNNTVKSSVKIVNEFTDLIDTAPDSPLGERSIASQMGRKEMSAFTKFAKEMRTKIIQQEPGISFTRVASELASRWRKLEECEKNKYESLAKKEKEEKLSSKHNVSAESTSKPPVIKTAKPESKNKLKKMDYYKVYNVAINMESLQSMLDKRTNCTISHAVKIFGKIDEDMRCSCDKDGFYILSNKKLNEAVCFFKNMSTMSLPLKVLDKNLKVDKSSLDVNLWHILESLETSIDLKSNSIIISNDIITKNGFRIEVVDGEERIFHITDVPAHISYYGVEDLKEILKIMLEKGTHCELEKCRPLKVTNFIRSETIRTASTSFSLFDDKDINSRFKFWKEKIYPIFPDCPHHKPVIHAIQSFT